MSQPFTDPAMPQRPVRAFTDPAEPTAGEVSTATVGEVIALVEAGSSLSTIITATGWDRDEIAAIRDGLMRARALERAAAAQRIGRFVRTPTGATPSDVTLAYMHASVLAETESSLGVPASPFSGARPDWLPEDYVFGGRGAPQQ